MNDKYCCECSHFLHWGIRIGLCGMKSDNFDYMTEACDYFESDEKSIDISKYDVISDLKIQMNKN